ncbi:MAG: DUF58 domain-containing protein [Ignavibacteria bacterium]
MESSSYRKYLNPLVISKLTNLELKARLVVEGFITGLHKSPYHGFSVEFAEHRQYMPGDDLKYFDWKVYGKTEKSYIKQFEEETNLRSYLLIDISKSMMFSSLTEKYQSNRITKLEYASYISASLAYLMLLQRDAVGLATYDTQLRTFIPPSSTKANFLQLLKTLDGIKSIHTTSIAKSLNQIAERVKKRSLIIVISDFFETLKDVIRALRHFHHNKNEVIVFQVLDPLELNFFNGAAVKLVDIETREEMFSKPSLIQQSYRESLQQFLTSFKSECLNYGIDYNLLTTSTFFDRALLGYLRKRKKLF